MYITLYLNRLDSIYNSDYIFIISFYLFINNNFVINWSHRYHQELEMGVKFTLCHFDTLNRMEVAQAEGVKVMEI